MHILSLLLKDRPALFALARESRAGRYAFTLFLCGVFAAAAFGLSVLSGVTSSSVWLRTWKTVAILWGTLLIALPSLFVFSATAGAKFTLRSFFFVTVSAFSLVGIVLLSFAPITAFLAWIDTEPFVYRAVVTLMFGLSYLFGAIALDNGFRAAGDDTTKAKASGMSLILMLWLGLYIYIAHAMTWELKFWQ